MQKRIKKYFSKKAAKRSRDTFGWLEWTVKTKRRARLQFRSKNLHFRLNWSKLLPTQSFVSLSQHTVCLTERYPKEHSEKESDTRFRLQVFFMNQCPLGP